MNKIIMALTVCLALAGCQEAAKDQTPPPPAASAEAAAGVPDLREALAHHNFVIQSLDGRELPETNPDGSRRERPHLSFSQWPQAGGKICNSFHGQLELEGDTLTMTNAASTMMFCTDPDLNELESAFHQMLNAGAKAELRQNRLTLTGGGHTIVLSLFDYVN